MDLTGELFFTSDTHFYHTNIIQYCSRPFSSAVEMNQEFISQWNSVVKPNDTVFHLGDVALGCSEDRFDELFAQLNGTKILVVGNHDGGVVKRSSHWKEVAKNMVLSIGGYSIQLNHRPTFENFKDWDMFLYGHVHGRMEPTGTTLDVGVDSAKEHLGAFRPMSLSEVVTIMEKYERR